MGTRALAALALVAALGAGCTGDPEPKIADPTPSPSSAAPSPSVTEAVDPEQAYQDFIDGYVAAISESLSTGDPSTWLAMSDPACENCQGIASELEDAYESGGRIDGAQWTVSSAKYETTTDLGDVWYVTIDRTEERWLDASGSATKVVRAGQLRFGLAIAGGPPLAVRELKPLES